LHAPAPEDDRGMGDAGSLTIPQPPQDHAGRRTTGRACSCNGCRLAAAVSLGESNTAFGLMREAIWALKRNK
jgi:hypothetical protein